MSKYLFFFFASFLMLIKTIDAQIPCSANFTSTTNGNTVSFFPVGNLDSSVLHSWDFGDGATGNALVPVHTYNSCGTYNVVHHTEIFNSNGVLVCEEIVTQTIVLQCATPCNAHALFSASNVGSQSNVYEFINTSVVDPNSTVLCVWDFGDGSSATSMSADNQTHSYAQAGIYMVCLSLTTTVPSTNVSCTETFCMSIQVQSSNPQPCNLTPEFIVQPLPTQSTTLIFSNTTSGLDSNTVITWDFGDNTTGTGFVVTHPYQQVGNYIVCMHIAQQNACMADTCISITVDSAQTPSCNLSADFTANSMGLNANGYTYSFINTSISNTPIVSYFWDFGDGMNIAIASPVHVYSTPGTYQVCLTAINSTGCTDQKCISIVWSDSTPICSLTAQFSHTNGGANTSSNTFFFANTTFDYMPGDSVFWSFGDGSVSSEINPIHIYSTPGNYLVCLKVSSLVNMPGAPGCESEYCDTVNVNSDTVIVNTPTALLPYPNPAQNQVSVNVSLTSTTTLYAFVYNSQGMQVLQATQSGLVGNNIVTIDISMLPAGFYTLRLYYNQGSSVSGFLKL